LQKTLSQRLGRLLTFEGSNLQGTTTFYNGRKKSIYTTAFPEKFTTQKKAQRLGSVLGQTVKCEPAGMQAAGVTMSKMRGKVRVSQCGVRVN